MRRVLEGLCPDTAPTRLRLAGLPMTGDSPKHVPSWLVVDVAILLVGLALIVLGFGLAQVRSRLGLS
jgi:hypothetical protein